MHFSTDDHFLIAYRLSLVMSVNASGFDDE